MIPYGRHDVNQADVDAVVEVLRSDFLTQGSVVPRFEQAVATMCRAHHALAFNSATSALHAACLALGLGPGDFLWTVPNTFVASANCARYCGAGVDFIDIDPATWNMSVARLREKLVAAHSSGTLPKVVVPVHFAGQPTEQGRIWELAREFGFRVLEDASHAIGAARNDEPVGSCRWSDITVFSLHPVKIITAGEGGIALTNDAELAGRMALARSHGITREPERFVGPSGPGAYERELSREGRGNGSPKGFGAWYYEQQALGFNFRMTEIHAALGLSQLARLDEFVRRRNVLARRYDERLRRHPLRLPSIESENRCAFHLYVVRLQGGPNPARHRKTFDALRERGIGVNVHYMPVHLQPYYRALGFAPGQYPEAEAHGATAITLPLYPRLSEAEQDRVVEALEKVLACE